VSRASRRCKIRWQDPWARSTGSCFTGDQHYLETYNRVVADVEPRLENLRVAYVGSDAGLSQVRDLHVLIGKRLAI